MNATNTGNKIPADIEPTETILVSAIRINANTKHINPICQFIVNRTPNDVAIPFPPLNPKRLEMCVRLVQIFLQFVLIKHYLDF